MVKVKSCNLLLVLMLLFLIVISCNLKFPKDTVQGNLFEKDLRGAKLTVSNFDKLTLPFKRHEEVNFAKVNEVNEVNEVEKVNEVEESIEFKLDKLLGTFNIQDEGKGVIEYIRSVVTDPGIVGRSIDRTYADSKFYNLLVSLGDARLKKIIAVHLKTVKEQNKALAVVENLNLGDLKEAFKAKIDRNTKKYKLAIEKAFNSYRNDDDIVREAVNIDYESIFIGIGKFAEDAKKGKDLCAGLFDKGKEIIESIRNILTNPDIPGAKTYTDVDFYILLGRLGSSRATGIMKAYIRVLQEQDNALRAIENINEGILKLKLTKSFNEHKDAYPEHLKWLFRIFNLNDIIHSHSEVYRAVAEADTYVYKFTKIKESALGVIDGQRLCAGLQGPSKDAIDYIQSIVTNPDICSDKNYRTYADDEFYLLLDELNALRVMEIIAFHLDVLKERVKIKLAIDDVGDEKLKQELIDELTELNNFYPLHLKGIFGAYDTERVYRRFKDSAYLYDQFNIGDKALANKRAKS
ncbi:BTA121 domain-containing protein surface lipoprotein [Borrelia hermsii]|nr:hypothetical protein [Borrelia hermsii]